MHGQMKGLFELRVDGAKRHHYRLFCILDSAAKGRDKPLLVVLTGLDKPFKSTFSAKQYATVRSLRNEYLSRNPRSVT